MSSFPPKLPWNELYERSGLKTISDRVRQQPLVKQAEEKLEEFRATVAATARDTGPRAASAAEWLIRQLVGEQVDASRSVVNASQFLLRRELSLPLADRAIAAMISAASQPHFRGGAESIDFALFAPIHAERIAAFGSLSAATIATLSALAREGAVVVARHQVCVLEGTPLPELLAAAGVSLREVGTVDRTTDEEYRQALQADGGRALLQICDGEGVAARGNSHISGEQVRAIARECGKPSVVVVEMATLERDFVQTPADAIGLRAVTSSSDLSLFPGDRLLGGPGCGLLAGSNELVKQIVQHPLGRALLADGITCAGLLATLELLKQPETSCSVPMVQWLAASAENLKQRAERIVAQLEGAVAQEGIAIEPVKAYLHERAETPLEGWSIVLTPTGKSGEELTRRLRTATPAILAEFDLAANRVRLHLRGVLPGQDEQIVQGIRAIYGH